MTDTIAAHHAVRRSLFRPSHCHRCGYGGRIDGHHYAGYAPHAVLCVVWLCQSCHNSAHHHGEDWRAVVRSVQWNRATVATVPS